MIPRALTTLIASCCTLFTLAQAERMDSLLRVIEDRTGYNGVVLVAEHGHIVYQKAFGIADRTWNVPNAMDTRFQLASLGKPFTALLILQLAEAGRLRLDDTIGTYIPEFPARIGGHVTIRQVLGHTSGIPNYQVIPDFDEVAAKLHHTPEAFLALFQDKDLLFTPGTHFHYTNLGYFTLALIAERVSGKPFNTLLKEQVFGPAGMVDTYTQDERRVMPRSATGHMDVYTHFERAPYRDPTSVLGAGNITSTAPDLLRFDRALHEGKLLSPGMQQQMYTPGLDGYGLGWMMMTYPAPGRDSVTVAYHDGGGGGFSTIMYRFLEDDRCIIALSNVGRYDMYTVAARLARLWYGREVPPVKRSLVARFAVTAERDGFERAAQEFRALRDDPEHVLDGSAFNSLGYDYLRQGRIDAAVRVFELNVEAFPNVADPYDSLAEGYMRQGKKELAIANYRRSLELDPTNVNATVMLKKLEQP